MENLSAASVISVKPESSSALPLQSSSLASSAGTTACVSAVQSSSTQNNGVAQEPLMGCDRILATENLTPSFQPTSMGGLNLADSMVNKAISELSRVDHAYPRLAAKVLADVSHYYIERTHPFFNAERPSK
ncbi:unnamed protein product [Protopolystoma xenopodis]|uniref:Uncharacterized protein n=1 Tax=Protopolystoma xenopodis TaxID=117903 RepID=A0A448X416_9PLAT|nr:unnamed protein product [Protopolystoma xenopodis]